MTFRRATSQPPGRLHLAAVALLGASLLGAAPAADPAPDARALRGIHVTAPPVTEPERQDTTASSTSVPQAEFAPRQLTLPEVLLREAGLGVQRFGGLGAFSQASIRGSTGQQVLVYYDGVPLNRAAAGIADLSAVPLTHVAEIQIYRGVVPAVYGGSAPGGVIDIIPRRARGGELSASAGFGSFLTRQAAVFGAVGGGGPAPQGWSAAAGVGYRGTRGDFRFDNDQGTRFDTSDDVRVHRKNNGYDGLDALLNVAGPLGGRANLQLTQATFYATQGVPGAGYYQAQDAHLRRLRALQNLRIAGEVPGLPGTAAAVNGFYTFDREQFDDPKGEVGLYRDATDYRTHQGGGNMRLDHVFADAVLARAFFEGRRERFFPGGDSGGFKAPQPSGRTHFTGAADLDARIEALKLNLVPLFRAERVQDSLYTEERYGDPNPRTLDVSRTVMSWRGGLRFEPWPYVRLTANVGSGYRHPEFVELYGNNGTLVGNAALLPEKSLNWDAGVAGGFTAPRGHAFRAETIWFRNDVRNLIEFVPASAYTLHAENLDRARLQGLESAVDAEWRAFFRARYSHTYLDTVDQSDVPARRGKVLPLRPKTRSSLHVEPYLREVWFWSEAAVWVDYDYVAGNFADAANLVPIPARHYLGAGVKLVYGVNEVIAAFEAKNLLDRQTADAIGYPLPGRGFFVSVTYNLPSGNNKQEQKL